MTTAYIALGSNLGERRAYLERALEELRGRPGVAVGRVSQLCCDAANIYNMANGARGIYSSMPIQRIQRDLQAISLHAVNMPVKNYELYGRVLCGLEPNTFFI